jgi:hypothetical protein
MLYCFCRFIDATQTSRMRQLQQQQQQDFGKHRRPYARLAGEDMG